LIIGIGYYDKGKGASGYYSPCKTAVSMNVKTTQLDSSEEGRKKFQAAKDFII